jgi:hypothetical protein
MEQVREHYRNLAQQQVQPAPAPAPEPRKKSRGHSRSRREASPQHQQEPQPNYSPNLPPHLRELLKYQSQIPYNIIANQVAYRGADKPYVPHHVELPQQQQPKMQQAQYQGQGGAYETQASAYTQARYNPDQQYQQQNYGQQQQPGVRPVTENQY